MVRPKLTKFLLWTSAVCLLCIATLPRNVWAENETDPLLARIAFWREQNVDKTYQVRSEKDHYLLGGGLLQITPLNGCTGIVICGTYKKEPGLLLSGAVAIHHDPDMLNEQKFRRESTPAVLRKLLSDLYHPQMSLGPGAGALVLYAVDAANETPQEAYDQYAKPIIDIIKQYPVRHITARPYLMVNDDNINMHWDERDLIHSLFVNVDPNGRMPYIAFPRRHKYWTKDKPEYQPPLTGHILPMKAGEHRYTKNQTPHRPPRLWRKKK